MGKEYPLANLTVEEKYLPRIFSWGYCGHKEGIAT